VYCFWLERERERENLVLCYRSTIERYKGFWVTEAVSFWERERAQVSGLLKQDLVARGGSGV